MKLLCVCWKAETSHDPTVAAWRNSHPSALEDPLEAILLE